MPVDDWLPWVAAAGGFLTAAGAVVKLFFDRNSNTQTHMNALLDQYQEDRQSDRQVQEKLNTKVDTVLALYADEREYSAILLAWGLAGAPPPPPQRRVSRAA